MVNPAGFDRDLEATLLAIGLGISAELVTRLQLNLEITSLNTGVAPPEMTCIASTGM